jgi:hypothetical protein
MPHQTYGILVTPPFWDAALLQVSSASTGSRQGVLFTPAKARVSGSLLSGETDLRTISTRLAKQFTATNTIVLCREHIFRVCPVPKSQAGNINVQ